MGDPQRAMTLRIVAIRIIAQILFGGHGRGPERVDFLAGHVGGRRRKFGPPVSGRTGVGDLHTLRLGPSAFARRDGERAAHPFGCNRNGDRAVARAGCRREFQCGIGTRRAPRSVGSYRNAVSARRVEAQLRGSERERHFGRSRGTGHGDGLAGDLARSGAHPNFDGRSPGHLLHPEGSVADARRRIGRHGRRGRFPVDLPRTVGHHTDRIVGVVGLIESERPGFDGGIGFVRGVVTAAGGEQKQAG